MFGVYRAVLILGASGWIIWAYYAGKLIRQYYEREVRESDI